MAAAALVSALLLAHASALQLQADETPGALRREILAEETAIRADMKSLVEGIDSSFKRLAARVQANEDRLAKLDLGKPSGHATSTNSSASSAGMAASDSSPTDASSASAKGQNGPDASREKLDSASAPGTSGPDASREKLNSASAPGTSVPDASREKLDLASAPGRSAPDASPQKLNSVSAPGRSAPDASAEEVNSVSAPGMAASNASLEHDLCEGAQCSEVKNYSKQTGKQIIQLRNALVFAIRRNLKGVKVPALSPKLFKLPPVIALGKQSRQMCIQKNGCRRKVHLKGLNMLQKTKKMNSIARRSDQWYYNMCNDSSFEDYSIARKTLQAHLQDSTKQCATGDSNDDGTVLTIHLRGGGDEQQHQPPCAFYKRIIRSGEFRSVRVVTGYDNNPCIDHLKKLSTANLTVTVQSDSVESDACALLRAKHVALSYSTFSWALAWLSNHATTIYTPDCRWAMWFAHPQLRPRRTVKVLAVEGLHGKRENSTEQAKWMLNNKVGHEEVKQCTLKDRGDGHIDTGSKCDAVSPCIPGLSCVS